MGKTFKSLAIGILSLAVLLLVLHAAWDWMASRALIRELDRQTKAGLPMALRDIVPPAVPAADNAAPILRRAFSAMRDERRSGTADKPALDALLLYDFPDVFSVSLAAPAPPAIAVCATNRQAILAAVSRPDLAPVFALLEQAAARPACNFELDYSRGAGILLPHLASMRSAVRMLALRAYARAPTEPAAAFADLSAALRLAEFLDEEPILISQLVRLAGRASVLRCLNLLLNELPPDRVPAGPLELLAARLDGIVAAGPQGLVRAIDGERIILGKQTFEGMLRGRVDRNLIDSLDRAALWLRLTMSRPGRAVVRPMLKADFRCYMKTMAEVRRRAMLPPADAARLPAVSKGVSRSAALTAGLVPALDSCLVQWHTALTQADMARVGIRLAQVAVVTGHYPVTLDRILPGGASPVDPHTGKPYTYLTAEGGLTLASADPKAGAWSVARTARR